MKQIHEIYRIGVKSLTKSRKICYNQNIEAENRPLQMMYRPFLNTNYYSQSVPAVDLERKRKRKE
ncbi:hypothetical protein CE91St64_36760 [Faecalicatena contorta]|nr:hypothetical protein CE91St64_36760 [Faecalicatena contorta]